MTNFRYIYLGLFGFIIIFSILFAIAAKKTRETLGVKETGHLYVISVDDHNNSTTHTSDSIVSETERCIEFRNEFGIIEKECGDRISKLTIK